MQTELGRITGLTQTADADRGTPLQRKLDSFGRILVWVALGIVALLFGLGLLGDINLLELFMTSVGLAVAAVPEGLPAGHGGALGWRPPHGSTPHTRAPAGRCRDARLDERHLHGQNREL